MKLVVVGDALLDRDLDGVAERLAPDAPVPVVGAITEHPRPGGAGLAAAMAAALGAETTLVCALGDDDAGDRLAGLISVAGVELCNLGTRGETPEKVRVLAGGRALVRLDAGGAGSEPGAPTAAARAALAAADAVLVSDYGRGVAAQPELRELLRGLVGVPIVWDPHPRGPAPVPGALLVTPNAEEAGAGPARPPPRGQRGGGPAVAGAAGGGGGAARAAGAAPGGGGGPRRPGAPPPPA